ncbi:hypothetical protein CHLRE_07g346317v5 [Chlamydomonas reinhardtii]|uniref:Glycosyl transferase CAP10 domain-containing protein n=1 Tax=Chlamydomonas reinhardtii TaxID=3055 RepID=A0A2K3DL10_CHLRE|nr:uncharacterized protein CHLRE_07g346317v5 [Chlamydomonas reinhardtii]XP_042923034.1 uncharacterized protein CHLRE_07g346317v5 [Chlamydomonas reinhardtii]PNW81197.1 hypothetical protein CHLRE_07g346317v5 [Chlamydomonas reinhardtii]PNW81198.1 hypothetical protein CHLRE_07g346317v5 [Chlamydomonas reinhardtii]
MVELLTARACALCLAYFVAMFAAAATSSASPAVKYVSEREGWQRAWTHEAMEPMYNASLYPDLAVFAGRIRLLSGLGIANQLRRYHMNSSRVKRGTAVVVVRGGRVTGLTFEDFNPAFRIRLDSVVRELQRHQDAGHITLPDSVFILNTRDVPVCSLGYCLVPMFSPVKEVRPGGKSYNEDLLVPHLAYPADELVEVEPADKIPRAGIAIHADEPAGSEGSCRWFVRKFARAGGAAAQWIDVLEAGELIKQQVQVLAAGGAAAAAGGGGGGGGGDGGAEARKAMEVAAGERPVSGMSAYPAPAACLARYQVALSCDSQAANPGLAGLLASNSLVLKGRSNWAEYYYRLLKVVKEAMLKSQAAKCAAIVERAQRFAYTYLSQRSRALFYEKAITEYNKLFGEGYMQATVADLPRDRPLAMSDILALPMYPSTWRQGLA